MGVIIGSVVFGNFLNRGCMICHSIVSFGLMCRKRCYRNHLPPSYCKRSWNQYMYCLRMWCLCCFHRMWHNIVAASTLCRSSSYRGSSLQHSWRQYRYKYRYLGRNHMYEHSSFSSKRRELLRSYSKKNLHNR